jgi:hypothetical protein
MDIISRGSSCGIPDILSSGVEQRPSPPKFSPGFLKIISLKCDETWYSLNLCKYVRFEVLAAVTKKDTSFWDVMECSLIEIYRRFGGTNCFYLPKRERIYTRLYGVITQEIVLFNWDNAGH